MEQHEKIKLLRKWVNSVKKLLDKISLHSFLSQSKESKRNVFVIIFQMYKISSNPFLDRTPYSSSYTHNLNQPNHYFPTSSSHSYKPAFLVAEEHPFPQVSDYVHSPYHDVVGPQTKATTSSGYKQNPFHKSHLLEDSSYIPRSAKLYS